MPAHTPYATPRENSEASHPAQHPGLLLPRASNHVFSHEKLRGHVFPTSKDLVAQPFPNHLVDTVREAGGGI